MPTPRTHRAAGIVRGARPATRTNRSYRPSSRGRNLTFIVTSAADGSACFCGTELLVHLAATQEHRERLPRRPSRQSLTDAHARGLGPPQGREQEALDGDVLPPARVRPIRAAWDDPLGGHRRLAVLDQRGDEGE